MIRLPAHQTPLSGRQYTLHADAYTATIASVGASLRVLQHRDRDLVVPFEADQLRPAYRGAILAPWPNRVVEGRYTYDGVTQQLALTEPDRGHALHGLAVWHDFAGEQTDPKRVELQTQLPAQQGYPHQIEVAVSYELDEHGLLTSVTGTNVGRRTAPWGTAPHPYLVAGGGRVDDWSLELPANSILTVTPDRLVPVGIGEVATTAGGTFDFRIERSLDGIEIDHAFTHLARDEGGVTTVRLRDSTGMGVAMTFDEACPWVQIHTADLPEPSLNRVGLAIEPMTCAPDAFNSGVGLIHLAPGESHRATWRIQAMTPEEAR